MTIKKGNQVKVLTGKDRGKTGEVLEIDRKMSKIKIKSINIIKKHLKPTTEMVFLYIFFGSLVWVNLKFYQQF